MIAALITLAVALAAAAGTDVVLAALLVRRADAGAHLEVRASAAESQRDVYRAELERVRTAAASDVGRYERLIADLKRRAAAAEERALAASAPGAVRDDLRGLLTAIDDAGHADRALAAGDVLPLRAAAEPAEDGAGGSGGAR